jgi:hypothetical protein
MNGSGITYFGLSAVPSNSNPFDGLIDQLSVSYYVKNSSEILDEATLLCRYSFETDNINADSGPNNIPADSEDVYPSLPNYLLFNSTDSYFQSSGFTLLMSNMYEFTIAFWIRPIIMESDNPKSAIAIMQLATKVQLVTSEAYVCFLAIDMPNISTDEPYLRYEFGQLNMYAALNQYKVRNNTWTHIGVTYSNGTKITSYINGMEYNYIIDSRFLLLIYNPRITVTIGGNIFDVTTASNASNYETRQCFAQNPPFDYTQMYGEIAYFQVFSRALNNSEFATLVQSETRTSS